jgi:hypothetical protein
VNTRRVLLPRSDISLSARGESLTLRAASLTLNRYFLCHKSLDTVHEGRIPHALKARPFCSRTHRSASAVRLWHRRTCGSTSMAAASASMISALQSKDVPLSVKDVRFAH